jgi:two-component system chemotaxis response regulator CheB
MRKVRVLIVDDEVVARRALADLIDGSGALEVVGTAPTGRVALDKLRRVVPDVVLLDVDMPELGGLGTLAALRQTHPHLPVIMISHSTQRGAPAALDALTLGAHEWFALPEGTRNLAEAVGQVWGELLPTIKRLGGKQPTGRSSLLLPPAPSGAPTAAPVRSGKVEVVAVGASTGGPAALMELLSALPATFPVPIVVVQHMPPTFTQFLAERLAARCALVAREARCGERLAAGQVWLAPGGQHLVLERRGPDVFLGTNQAPAENSCRPSVDVLFRSAVQAYGGGALMVVLTGMGQDGLRGCEVAKQAGSQVLVQDEATSVVWGMPGYVARAGLHDALLPLGAIAPEIERLARKGRSASTVG